MRLLALLALCAVVTAEDSLGARLARAAGEADPLIQAAPVGRAKALGAAASTWGTGRGLAAHQRREITGLITVQCVPGTDPVAVLAAHGLTLASVWPQMPGTVLARTTAAAQPVVEAVEALRADPAVVAAQALLTRQHAKRLTFTDPLFAQQWHLKAGAGETDIQPDAAWDTTLGTGITIAVVDDGLQATHEDLAANAQAARHRNINYGGSDPAPHSTDDGHGTVVGGLMAARGGNDLGVVGVAPRAGLAGVVLISAATTDAEDAAAMTHLSWAEPGLGIDVSNNSWGVADDGVSYGSPGLLMRAALATGVSNGRGGRGIVYVWSAGNGADIGDNASWDGYVNRPEVVAVGAVDHTGRRAYYSESGPNLLVCAPGGDAKGMVSTDLIGSGGFQTGNYTTQAVVVPEVLAIGTSFSAPVVSGVAALVLAARPTLSWRDVHDVLVRSARKNDAANVGWSDNAAGLHFNPRYGFGLVSASAAVAAALVQVPMPQRQTWSVSDATGRPIPDAGQIDVALTLTTPPADAMVEQVLLTLDVTHPYRGDLAFTLTSPSGTVMRIANRADDNGANLSSVDFLVVQARGEPARGAWSLRIDDVAPVDIGTLRNVRLQVFGHQPYPAPTGSSLTPSVLPTGTTPVQVLLNGTGFARAGNGQPITRVSIGSTDLAVAWVDDSHLLVTVPSSLLGSAAALSLIASNPARAGVGGGDTAPLTLTVNGALINRPPVIDTVGTWSVTSGATRTEAPVTAHDPESGVLSYSIPVAPALGTAAVTSNGVVTYTAGATTGSDRLLLQVSDSLGASAYALVPITVVPASPVLTSPGSAVARTTAPFSFSLTASGQPYRFSATGLPAGLVIDPWSGVIGGTASTPGTYAVSVGATNAGGTGTGSLSLRVASGSGGSDTGGGGSSGGGGGGGGCSAGGGSALGLIGLGLLLTFRRRLRS